MGSWNHIDSADQLVFSGSTPTSWTSLDLTTKHGGGSTGVPTSLVVALLKVEVSTGWPYIAFRPADKTTKDYYVNQTNGHGCCVITPNSAGPDACLVFVKTSSSAAVGWIAQNAQTGTVRVLGYMEVSDVDLSVHTGALPSSKTVLDLTQDVSMTPTGLTSEALAWLSYERTGGTTNEIAVIPNGDAGDWLTNGNAGASGGEPGASEVEAYVAITDSNGVCQHYADTVVPNATARLETFEQNNWTPDGTQVFSGTPPTTWTDLAGFANNVLNSRALVALRVHEENTAPGGNISVAFRAKGDTGLYTPNTSGYPMGTAVVDLDADEVGLVVFETSNIGEIQWEASNNTRDIDVELLGFVSTNNPPVISNGLPTGASEEFDVEVSFETSDDNSAEQTTIDLTLTDPDMGTHNAIVNGVAQTDYTATFVANGSNGHDVTLTEHPRFIYGLWQADASVEDNLGVSGSDSWTFTVVWTPRLVSARPHGRRALELIFNLPVRVRDVTQLVVEPTNRYTPVDWVGAGGIAADAARPQNYTISRPAGGNLDGGGEAVDPVVTWAEEHQDSQYWLDVVEGGDTIRYSERVILHLDYQMTPRADYRVEVEKLISQQSGPTIDPAADTADFVGFIVSHVIRNSLHLYDILPKVARRLDESGTGELQAFCTALQEVFDRITEDTDAFFDELCTIEYIREEFIDALLYDLGDQFSEQFDLTTIEKRRLSRSLVRMYKLKGTCPGLIDAIEFFLNVTITGCRGGWHGVGGLYKGSYPAATGGDFDLYKGSYPAATGGSGWLGPVGSQVHNLWLLHPTPGSLTSDELAKIEVIVELMGPADAHYKGVIAP